MTRSRLSVRGLSPRGRLARPVALAAIAACAAMLSGMHPGPATAVTPGKAEADPDVGAQAWASAKLRRMSLDEKIAQLFVVSVWGKSADEAHPTNKDRYGVDTPAEVVDRYQVGGVIYFNNSSTDNVDSPKQLTEFSNGLQRAATHTGARLPLVIAIDQEGGNVTRIESPATEYPSSMAVGAGRSTADAETLAAINGHELRAMGINQNFAPVADVNSNPENPVIGARSFASRPGLASDMVTAEVRGYQSGKRKESVSSSAKHFPGHGDASTDSHEELPVIDRSEQEWREVDLPPFQAAIDAGIDSIMTAHIRVPSLDDSDRPATLSRPIMTGLLRNELGFRGVIVTDSLGMGGANVFPPEEIPVMALEAGVDQLLMPPDLRLAMDSVRAAVDSGRLTEARIDRSVLRILELKWNRGILTHPYADPDTLDDNVGTPEHLAAIQDVSDRTTTVVCNDDNLLPLSNGDLPGRVLVTGVGDTVFPERSPGWLADSIAARGPEATALPTGTRPDSARIADAVAAAGESDLVVVLTNNLDDYTAQRDLVTALLDSGTPVVPVATQVPYDVGFVDAPTWVASYAWRAVSMESLAKVLFGEVSPNGALPVDVPAGDDPDTIRYPFGTGLTW